MILKTTLKPVALFTFVAFTTLVSPVFALTAFDGDDVSENETGSPTSTLADTAQTAAVQENVISGDFGSVDWKSLVGQKLTITGEMVIVDTYDLARRGQVKVARKRLYVPTSQIDPNDVNANENSFEGGSNVANVVKTQKFNDQATIIIDDGLSQQNVFPPTLFPELGKTLPSVRIGSTIQGVSGKLVQAGPVLLLVPDGPLRWTPAKRPERPSVGDANATVASFNVLNYFTTIDNGKNQARGANTEAELKRQEAKLVSAILGLKADVVGLMEIENNLEAEMRLVNALNEKAGRQVFAGRGFPADFRNAPGGQDAIRVGMIYRTDRVKPVGDVLMVADDAFLRARTPIVQTFRSSNGGKPFTVIVNHFKSKGGASSANKANKNKGDGQGAYNATRRAQSLAICRYLDRMKQADSNFRALVIGDLNAYQQEDPIDAMRANGLVDLHERFKSANGTANADYSYVYRGQSGSLDHAMATVSMAADVTGLATWHINADEPRSMDYNQEYNPKSLYQPDPFRSSDHDPVLIGIRN